MGVDTSLAIGWTGDADRHGMAGQGVMGRHVHTTQRSLSLGHGSIRGRWLCNRHGVVGFEWPHAC